MGHSDVEQRVLARQQGEFLRRIIGSFRPNRWVPRARKEGGGGAPKYLQGGERKRGGVLGVKKVVVNVPPRGSDLPFQ